MGVVGGINRVRGCHFLEGYARGRCRRYLRWVALDLLWMRRDPERQEAFVKASERSRPWYRAENLMLIIFYCIFEAL
jgi:hypothetical protein